MIKKPFLIKNLGLVYGPDERMAWASHSCLTPTPMLLSEDKIRIYGGFRDSKGISRIGYVDVCSSNPAKVVGISEEPVLDLGRLGTFDDNGIMPCEVYRDEKRVFLYYAGFQKVENIKFQAFTGLCESTDGGNSFERVKETPVMDRSPEGLFIRTIHSVIFEENKFKIWYVGGSDWVTKDDTQYAKYQIYYTESKDGINFNKQGTLCISLNESKGEYRIGRPRVLKNDQFYEMTFTYSRLNGEVGSGYAYSKDGLSWKREDKVFPLIPYSEWNSQGINLPYTLQVGERFFLFHTGNENGKDGFGCSEIGYEQSESE